MKKFFLPIAILLGIVACHAQDNPALQKTKEGSMEIPSFLNLKHVLVVDPYFTESTDTFSTHGPQSITRNVLQDRKGTFWFATWQGIISYDGHQFVNHTLRDNLKHTRVFSLLEDNAGHIWFGLILGGVYRYDGKSFTCFTTLDGLPNNDVLHMMQDKSGDIWFGTDDGVSRYNGKSFTNYTTADGLSGRSVNWIEQDRNGSIWFGTRYGAEGDVSVYDGKSIKDFPNVNGERFNNIRSIVEDSKGIIWIGGQSGLYRFDGRSIDQQSTTFIGYLLDTKERNLLLCQMEEKGMGLYRYDGKDFSRIGGDDQVFGFIEDQQGNIWFGTPHGVSRYDGKSITRMWFNNVNYNYPK